MTKLSRSSTDTLSDYIKEAGGSLFSLRNSFAPRPGKKMSAADKALLAELYSRARRGLFGDVVEEADERREISP